MLLCACRGGICFPPSSLKRLQERKREGEREREDPGKHIHFQLIVRYHDCQVHTQTHTHTHKAVQFGRTSQPHPAQTPKTITHTVPLAWETSSACGTQIKTITTSPADAGSPCDQKLAPIVYRGEWGGR